MPDTNLGYGIMKKSILMRFVVAIVGLLFLSGCQKESVNVTVSGELNGHSYVDLGLPSGTLWATCNVGANNPEEEGNHYAWGETRTKGSYSMSNYKYGQQLDDWVLLVNKYCSNPEYGVDGFTDNLKRLVASDDVATVTWGDNWRMPTNNEFLELVRECSWQFTKYRGTEGILFTGSNGNSVFFPSVFFISGVDSYEKGSRYWSSVLDLEEPCMAFCGEFSISSDGDCTIASQIRCAGLVVRPVADAR